MMASGKFFTWTKGERKLAMPDTYSAGGVVPIPIECLTITGMDFDANKKGSGKMRRRPLPLSFDPPHDSEAISHSYTGDSLALRDATMQSATSLMAVVNDMLKSPLLSAHLSARQNGGLQPLQAPGRPRSHTAPSTPNFDVPYLDLPELPGCTPSWAEPRSTGRPSIDTEPASIQSICGRSDHGNAGDNILVSPKESSFAVPPLIRPSYDLERPRMSTKPSNDHLSSPPDPASVSHGGASTSDLATTPAPLLSLSDSFEKSLRVPPLVPRIPSNSTKEAATPLAKNQQVASHVRNISKGSPIPVLQDQQADKESGIIEQLALMRAKHSEHVRSLNEAHEREISVHQSYITFLEKRTIARSATQPNQTPQLSLTTSPIAEKSLNLVNPKTATEAPETTLSEEQKPALRESNTIDSLKRKLSLFQKAQTELGEVRKQRDQLRDASERGDKRIAYLKDVVRKAKENDQALKNAVANLEARLVAANTERADVLEGLHEACEQNRILSMREIDLLRERDELRSRLFYADPQWATSSQPSERDNGHPLSITNDSGNKRASLRSDPLLQELDALRQSLAQKEDRILELEKAAQDTTPKTTTRPVSSKQIESLKTQLKEAEEARDSYSLLLHTELRRQIRQSMQKHFKPSPRVALDTSSTTPNTLKPADQPSVSSVAASEGGSSSNATEETPEPRIENELKHCIEEIIMYKLDIKGYKKDLKKAKAKIDSLQALNNESQNDSLAIQNSLTTSDARQKRAGVHIPGPAQSPGLGILLPVPNSAPIIMTPMCSGSRNQEKGPPSESPPPTTETTSSESTTPRPVIDKTLSPPASHNIQTKAIVQQTHPMASAPMALGKSSLSTHKKLPKPPCSPDLALIGSSQKHFFPISGGSSVYSAPLPPLPSETPHLLRSELCRDVQPPTNTQTFERAGTLRSLSDSIISSYANRSPPAKPKNQNGDVLQRSDDSYTNSNQCEDDYNAEPPALEPHAKSSFDTDAGSQTTDAPSTPSATSDGTTLADVPRIQSMASSDLGSPLSLHISDAVAVPIAKFSGPKALIRKPVILVPPRA